MAARYVRSTSTLGQIDVTYDASTCSAGKAVILYGSLHDYGTYAGCAQSDAGRTGSATIPASGIGNAWFLLLWTDGTTAGHAGYASNGFIDVPRSVEATGFCGVTADDHAAPVCGATGTFDGSIVLGAPTSTSVAASVYSATASGQVRLQYGTVHGAYGTETGPAALEAGTPARITLSGLSPDTRYYYRVLYDAPGSEGAIPTLEHTFHTARPAGSAFTFTVQADPHLDDRSSLEIYLRTLSNALFDGAEFHVDLGDTFMCEKYSQPFTGTIQPAADEATVVARYRFERGNFGTLAHSAPLFLVNGNHEGEAGWLNDGTAQNLAVWTTSARQRYYLNPVPDGFYSGDTASTPFVGQRASWYAWHWGEALFVVLDPYWNSMSRPGRDGWALTLGASQYHWLEATLAASADRYKFVFIHNLVGGLDGQMRGGIEAVPYYEWGGLNADGTWGFSTRRPGWSAPIHELLKRHGVTAVFHGHDHFYGHQVLDGIVYQEVPQPGAINSTNGPSLAAAAHYDSGTILSSSGYLRVTVAPGQVTGEYVRTWLPSAETATRRNRDVDDRWVVVRP